MKLMREGVWPGEEVRLPDPGISIGHEWPSQWTRALRQAASNPIVLIIAAALAWRLVSAFTGFFVNLVLPAAQPQPFSVFDRPHPFWDALARFDSGWYFGIARNGYQWVPEGRNNLAFFPLYPKLMGYLGYWFGGGQANYYLAGILISWTSFAAAMAMLYRLARLDVSQDAALRACVLAGVFPFAFFYGAVYPSSLFVLLSVTAFWAFRSGHWWLGAVAGALVTCTRVNGILILPPLALLVFEAWRHDRLQVRRAVLALCAVPLGVGLYSLFAYSISGSFLEWAYSIQRWNYYPGRWPFRVFQVVSQNIDNPYAYLTTVASAPYDFLNGAAAMGALVALPFVYRRLGGPYALYIALNLALPLSSGEFEGLGRYTAVLFPLFIWLGAAAGHVRHTGLVALFAMFYMLCQALFVTLRPLY